MADSKRQKIVAAIVTRLKLIDGNGSYDVDLNDHVEDSRTNWDQNELPAISVFDGDAIANPTSEGDYKSNINLMAVMIQGHVEQGTTAAAARTLVKNIMTAIRQDDKWIVSGTPLVMQTREVVNRITRNPESNEVEGCEVEISVQFITNKFNAE